MAIRKDIVWTVADDLSISPTTPQAGGAQGEDKAVRVRFVLGTDHPLVKDGYQLYIECEDPTGAYDKTDVLETDAEGAIAAEVPLAWTQYGGTVRLNVAAEKEGARVETDVATMTFRNRNSKLRSMQTLIQTCIQNLLNAAKDCVERAVSAASNAAGSANATYMNATAAADAAADAAAFRDEANGYKAACEVSATAAKEAEQGAATSATRAAEESSAAEKAAQNAAASANHADSMAKSATVASTAASESASAAASAAEEAKQAAEEASGYGGVSITDDGNGHVTVKTGGELPAVLYTEQALTDEEKAQARKNIGAGGGVSLKDVEEGFADRLLPAADPSDTYKIVRVKMNAEGGYELVPIQEDAYIKAWILPYLLPKVTDADAGKIPRAANGAWVLEDPIGDINGALEELHTYAQSLVSGGVAE